MSRKATERRFNPDAFVEANLWVVTRGRPYKPRFSAERAVVIVSGGGAVRADAQVAPPRTVHGRRAADASSPAEHSRDPPRHPLAAVLGAADAAAALFEDTACDAVYVLDFGLLRGDMRAELASPYPGRVAKSTARLLKKLNVSDALLAASGADVAVLLKVLSSAAENTKAVVLHEPDAAAPAAVLAGVRAAAGDGAARRLKGNLRVRYVPAELRDAGDSCDDGASVRSLLAEAFPDADATDAATDEREEAKESSERLSEKKNKNARERFAAAMASAARALESRDGVPPPPAWLAAPDAPVFYAHVTFEHDKHSKQIQQVARNVTDAVAAAAAAENAKAAVSRGPDAASVPSEASPRRRPGEDGETAAATDATTTAAPEERERVPVEEFVSADADYPTPNRNADDGQAPATARAVYVATRPFHPARLAKTLREHFARLETTPEVSAASRAYGQTPTNRRDGGAAAVAAAAARAAEAATEAASEAEKMVRALMRQSRGSSRGVDPATVAAASASASASAASASASAASAAATLLARLVSDEDGEPEKTDRSKTDFSPATQRSSRTSARAHRAPAGPFAGVTRSNGVVWLANRPFVRGAWTTPDARRPGCLRVACAGAWDAPSAASATDSADFAFAPNLCAFAGARRVELVFEGPSGLMDERAIRAALDACLLTEAEMRQDTLDEDTLDARLQSPFSEEKIRARDVRLCFAPWPDRAAHLASLGVTLGGRGSAALATVAATATPEWRTNAKRIVADAGETDARELDDFDKLRVASPTASFRQTTPLSREKGGLCFGGAIGVACPEAFEAPAKGTDMKQFPNGTGHFYPKMPCLECGSPWWLGDDWDAECANCGGDAESYDNEQKPHKAFKRRFARFRELIDELRSRAK
jgi:hypothetical protein